MNCREFQENLPSLLGHAAPSLLQAEAEAHVRSCSLCARLLAAAEGEAVPPDNLLAGVLEATTGSICAQLGERLVSYVDGES